MRLVKPVLFSMVLSALCLPAASYLSGTPSQVTGAATQDTEREPGGPLGAGVALVQLLDGGPRPKALVRMELLSGTDAEATVTEIDGPRGRALGQATSQAALHKGRPQTLLLESDLESGRLNHLYFRITARDNQGRETNTVAYLRVNLDPSLEPVPVGDYLEYQAAPGAEVDR